MELIFFPNTAAYEKAVLRRYQDTPAFINNKSGILKIVCNPNGAFFRNTTQKMIGVASGGEILCQCILIKHRQFDALTVAFFEAEEHAAHAVGRMMAYAEDFARSVGAKRLVVALDGHCNYSIGFSCGDDARPPLFGESRNPDYYHSFFQQGYRKLGFSCYAGGFHAMSHNVQALATRIEKRTSRMETQCANLSAFKAEIKRYTDLSNQIFQDHWYYYRREYDEDYELFKSMRPLLSPYHLIFAVNDGIDIGYILFYPDFNQLVPQGGKAGVGTFLRHKLLGAAPSVIKIAEIAVLPEFHASGAIIALFAEGCRRLKQHDPQVERVVSSWIADDNLASKRITMRFAPERYGSYAAYEKGLSMRRP